MLAFTRHYDQQDLLVLANLGGTVEYVELDLARFKGRVPVELFGQNPFPRVGELPYLLTLGPYAFYWFELVREEAIAGGPRVEAAGRSPISRPGAVGTPCSGVRAGRSWKRRWPGSCRGAAGSRARPARSDG